MDDLEILLRKEFDTQAASVPESIAPWREFRRRQNRRSAVLTAGVAAAAVVAIALAAVLVSRNPGATPTAVGSAPTVTTTTGIHTVGPPMPADLTSGPFWITDRDGWSASFYLRAGDVLCVEVHRKGQYVEPGRAECAKDDHAKPARVRAIGAPGGPFRDVLLVITAAGVHDFVLRDGGGAPVEVVNRLGSRGFDVGFADFPHGHQGFGYDGIDASGQHFSAIT